jgi:hypothetical protein
LNNSPERRKSPFFLCYNTLLVYVYGESVCRMKLQDTYCGL